MFSSSNIPTIVLTCILQTSVIGLFGSSAEEVTENKGTGHPLGEIVDLDDYVVSTSHSSEKQTEAPITIHLLNTRAIEQTVGPDPTQALASIAGIDFSRKNIHTSEFRIRGFNSPFNTRSQLMVDDRNANLIGIAPAYLQMNSFQKDDIQQIEVVLGPASVLYGTNAGMGLVHIITKDPRIDEGSTLNFGVGNQNILNTSFRHAEAVNSFFGYKVTGSYFKGTEFEYTDLVFYDPSPKNGIIAEGGVPEVGYNPDFEFTKFELGFYWRAAEDLDIRLNYGVSDNVVNLTSSQGRVQFNGLRNQFLQLKLLNEHWFAQIYRVDNRTTNDNSKLLTTYTQNVESYRSVDLLTAGAISYTEKEAQNRGLETRWAGFLTNPPQAAPETHLHLGLDPKFRDFSTRTVAELQYRYTENNWNFTAGTQIQRDSIDTMGTLFISDSGRYLKLDLLGIYAQTTYQINDQWKTNLAIRTDDHNTYGENLTSSISFVRIGDSGNWRISWGKGVLAPSPIEMHSSIGDGFLLGNSEGFTFTDGSKIDPLKAESISNFETGFNGTLNEHLKIDVNAYYTKRKDFITNATINIANPAMGKFVSHRGNVPISELQSPLFSVAVQAPALMPEVPGDASVSTFSIINYGNLATYGMDISLEYRINHSLTAGINYSYIGTDIDENDPANDLNNDGIVESYVDVQLNTPSHKAFVFLNYTEEQWFGQLQARWTQQYNFFSGNQVASETLPGLIYNGYPVIEGERVGSSFNEGPLGGKITFDISAGYHFNDTYTVSANVTNILDTAVSEFVSSPPVGRILYMELSINF